MGNVTGLAHVHLVHLYIVDSPLPAIGLPAFAIQHTSSMTPGWSRVSLYCPPPAVGVFLSLCQVAPLPPSSGFASPSLKSPLNSVFFAFVALSAAAFVAMDPLQAIQALETATRQIADQQAQIANLTARLSQLEAASATASSRTPRRKLSDPAKFTGKFYNTWEPLARAVLSIDKDAIGTKEARFFWFYSVLDERIQALVLPQLKIRLAQPTVLHSKITPEQRPWIFLGRSSRRKTMRSRTLRMDSNLARSHWALSYSRPHQQSGNANAGLLPVFADAAEASIL